MAGSYGHLLPGEDSRGGWPLIENMGDAYECVEELFWLVEKYIGRDVALGALEHFYAMKRGERPKDSALLIVEDQMNE